jgi:D-glycero-D-manno-heptose 1,7-bisphosphate phosphatase
LSLSRAAAGPISASTDRRGAVFLDRDGVLNEDTGFVWKIAEFKWMEGAQRAIKLLNDAGLFVFVVSNQSGVARGYFTESDVANLHHWMAQELAKEGARIDAFRYCPHHLDATSPQYRKACLCRKPEPGMILDLLDSWPVDRSRSLLIGDRPCDLEAAERADIPAFVFPGGNLADFVSNLILCLSFPSP